MADDYELDEDQEIIEADDEGDDEGDDEADDEAYAMMKPLPMPMPLLRGAAVPGVTSIFGGGFPIGRRKIKGVRVGIVSSGRGRATIQMPTPVATARTADRLDRRTQRAEALLGDQHRRLAQMARSQDRARYLMAANLGLQSVRDVAGEVRAAWTTAAARSAKKIAADVMPAIDYTSSSIQTALAVATIPKNRRSWVFWTLPLTAGLAAATAREIVRRPPTRRNWPGTVASLAAPAVAGAIGAALAYPRRPRRTIRYMAV